MSNKFPRGNYSVHFTIRCTIDTIGFAVGTIGFTIGRHYRHDRLYYRLHHRPHHRQALQAGQALLQAGRIGFTVGTMGVTLSRRGSTIGMHVRLIIKLFFLTRDRICVWLKKNFCFAYGFRKFFFCVWFLKFYFCECLFSTKVKNF